MILRLLAIAAIAATVTGCRTLTPQEFEFEKIETQARKDSDARIAEAAHKQEMAEIAACEREKIAEIQKGK